MVPLGYIQSPTLVLQLVLQKCTEYIFSITYNIQMSGMSFISKPVTEMKYITVMTDI